MSVIPHLIRSLCAVSALMLASQTAVLAHATLEQDKASANAAYKAVIKIGHGCEQTATTRLTVTIPDGVIAVKPMPKAGWTLTTQTKTYAKPYDYYHGKLTEGVREITWAGGNLPDAYYDEFTFQAFIARDVPADTRLFFPVVQSCEKGRNDWVEIPAANQKPHDLKSPAPSLLVLAAQGAAPQAVKAGSMVITAVRSRVTPAGAPVAGGYLTLTNQGQQADRLVSASVEIADLTEIHEMATKDGVMTMRALPDGLTIKPGETVDFKPGSFHLMFLKPKRPLVEGEVLKGRLVFEKAGPVSVEFRVEGMGGNRATPPAGAGGGHTGHVH